MNRESALVGIIVGVCVGLTGCFGSMPLPEGARGVYAKSFTCPGERVTVTPRPDIPPHTLIGHGADGTDPKPPPDVAADPGRLAMWQAQMAQKWAEVDKLGPPYEVEGCGKKAMLVCFHPTTLDVAAGQGAVVGEGGASISVNGAPPTLLGYVECVSGQFENKGKIGLGLDGMTVSEVRDGSPAALAGLVRGDVVVAVNQQAVTDPNMVVQLLKAENPAGHVISVRRADGNHDLTLRP